jgi:hypothetical protein
MGKKMKIQKNFKTKQTFFERLKLACKTLFKGNTHTFIIEDPVNYEAWILMKELKERKKKKK